MPRLGQFLVGYQDFQVTLLTAHKRYSGEHGGLIIVGLVPKMSASRTLIEPEFIRLRHWARQAQLKFVKGRRHLISD